MPIIALSLRTFFLRKLWAGSIVWTVHGPAILGRQAVAGVQILACPFNIKRKIKD